MDIRTDTNHGRNAASYFSGSPPGGSPPGGRLALGSPHDTPAASGTVVTTDVTHDPVGQGPSIADMPTDVSMQILRPLGGHDILALASTCTRIRSTLPDYQVLLTGRSVLRETWPNTKRFLAALTSLSPIHIALRRVLLRHFANGDGDAALKASQHGGSPFIAKLDAMHATVIWTMTGSVAHARTCDLLVIECCAMLNERAAPDHLPLWTTHSGFLDEFSSRYARTRVDSYGHCTTPAFALLSKLPLPYRAEFFETVHPLLGNTAFVPVLNRFASQFDGRLYHVSNGFGRALATALLTGTTRQDIRARLRDFGLVETQIAAHIDPYIEASLRHLVECGHAVPYALCERWRPGDETFAAQFEGYYLGMQRDQIRRNRSWQDILDTEGLDTPRMRHAAAKLVLSLEQATVDALSQESALLDRFVTLHVLTGSIQSSDALFDAYEVTKGSEWQMQPVLMDRLSSHLWNLLPAVSPPRQSCALRLRRRFQAGKKFDIGANAMLQDRAVATIQQIGAWRQISVARCLSASAPRLAARAYVAEISAWINLADLIPRARGRPQRAVLALADRLFTEIPIHACGEALDRMCRAVHVPSCGVEFDALDGHLIRFLMDGKSSACCPSTIFAQHLSELAARRWNVLPRCEPCSQSRFDAFCTQFDLRNTSRTSAWCTILDGIAAEVACSGLPVRAALESAGFSGAAAERHVNERLANPTIR